MKIQMQPQRAAFLLIFPLSQSTLQFLTFLFVQQIIDLYIFWNHEISNDLRVKYSVKFQHDLLDLKIYLIAGALLTVNDDYISDKQTNCALIPRDTIPLHKRYTYSRYPLARLF